MAFAERSMRVCALLCVALGLTLATGVGIPRADPGKEAEAERVAGLIRQLGHAEFAKREAASKELEAIGAPALDALRKAAAGDHPEVRRRAERILQAVTGRLRAAAARKELARWQGDWSGAEGQKLAIKGDQWVSSTPTFGPVSGTLKGIEVREQMTLVDLVVEAGPTKGQTCKVILRLDGDTLHYCGTYAATRPTEFKTAGNSLYLAWKRGKHPVARAVAPPPEVQFESAPFSTDLPLTESKAAVHRVVLKCRLADGSAGTLTLDPSVLKFDEFGNPAAGVPSPVVTLDCTLKLLKKDKQQQLYEIRGPKIVSRLSLVAYKDIMPWGDGRLLVRGKGGEVKYVIDLQLPQLRLKPCHPGCFPAGTAVRVPDGTKPIGRVREGDLVTTIDADGKPSAARVTDVFVTRNRLLEVRVEGGKLVTTETQPVGLAGGGFRPAGELKAGDRIWRWVASAGRWPCWGCPPPTGRRRCSTSSWATREASSPGTSSSAANRRRPQPAPAAPTPGP
jgi:uncharacterized protein (TIGR03067 family)